MMKLYWLIRWSLVGGQNLHLWQRLCCRFSTHNQLSDGCSSKILHRLEPKVVCHCTPFSWTPDVKALEQDSSMLFASFNDQQMMLLEPALQLHHAFRSRRSSSKNKWIYSAHLRSLLLIFSLLEQRWLRFENCLKDILLFVHI